MRWFRHDRRFRQEPFIARVRAELGSEGYAAVCFILEAVTGAWEDDIPFPELTLPSGDWRDLTGLSPKKLKKFWELCQDESFMVVTLQGKMVHVKAPILLKLMDDYKKKLQRKSGQSPKSIGTISATDKQEDQDVYKRQNNRHLPTKAEEREIRKVLHQHGIDPDSPRGERLYDVAASNATENFAGYIIGLLRKNPDYGRELDAIPHGERQNRPVAIGEILRQSQLLTGHNERSILTNDNSVIIDTKKES